MTKSFFSRPQAGPTSLRASMPRFRMKMELHMADPSVDWRAMVRMLEKRDDLRKDVTVVVEPDRLRFVDGSNREIPTAIPPGQWTEGDMEDLDNTLSFLAWVEERFPQPAE